MLDQNKAKKFLTGHIAIVGVSSKGRGFGVTIFKHLNERKFDISAVNPNGGSIDGKPVYKSLKDIQQKVDTIVTVVQPAETEKVVKEANELGINQIWMQFGSSSPEAKKYCEENGLDFIDNQCVIMFTEPIGFIHKFHKWIWKTTGQISKE
ncbi:MAG: CoA-binding protein [Ignavibacterium sp.]|nr:CoA-binding protein [Ignavibacterium sp.]